MYSQNPRVRDAQNPYRTGVLIGNYTEDRFGRMLAQQPVSSSGSLTPRRKKVGLAFLRTRHGLHLIRRFLLMRLSRALRRRFFKKNSKKN